MLTRRIIPCLDVSHGRVVKGIQFQNLCDAGDPKELAMLYEAQGADELALLDVSATPETRRTHVETVHRIRDVLSIPLLVGGGIRSVDDAQSLLEAGADKIAVNTAAVYRPNLIRELAERFGCQCTVLALDAARGTDGWEVVVRSGTQRIGRDVVEWGRTATGLGAGEILLTSWDRDGSRAGYDLDLIRTVAAAVSVPIIASGGASTVDHIADALRNDASAALAASIFHYGNLTVKEIKEALIKQGLEMRL